MAEEEKIVANVEENDGELDELLFGDSGKKDEFVPVEEGGYEFAIEDISRTKSPKGTPQIKFKLRIRKEVAQKEKGRIVWYTISQNPKDGKAFNWYRINQLILTQKGTPHYQERFKGGLDEVLLYLTDKHLFGIVTVEEGNEKSFNSIDGDTFEPSRWDKLNPVEERTEDGEDVDEEKVKKTNTERIEVSDSDLPF